MERVCIIDYGMGNLWSIESALKFLGARVIITNDREIISDSEKLILPGVGSFYKAMNSLNKLKLLLENELFHKCSKNFIP